MLINHEKKSVSRINYPQMYKTLINRSGFMVQQKVVGQKFWNIPAISPLTKCNQKINQLLISSQLSVQLFIPKTIQHVVMNDSSNNSQTISSGSNLLFYRQSRFLAIIIDLANESIFSNRPLSLQKQNTIFLIQCCATLRGETASWRMHFSQQPS